MRRKRRCAERGAIPWSGLLFVLVLGAIGYAAAVYVPVYLLQFRIENEARSLANRALVTTSSDDALIEKFLEVVEGRTGLELSEAEVTIDRVEDNEKTRVVVEYDIVIEFPFLDREEVKHVVTEVEVTRSRAY